MPDLVYKFYMICLRLTIENQIRDRHTDMGLKNNIQIQYNFLIKFSIRMPKVNYICIIKEHTWLVPVFSHCSDLGLSCSGGNWIGSCSFSGCNFSGTFLLLGPHASLLAVNFSPPVVGASFSFCNQLESSNILYL